jgi:hypothetical protein
LQRLQYLSVKHKCHSLEVCHEIEPVVSSTPFELGPLRLGSKQWPLAQ